MFTYHLVAAAGTFDRLHKGHEAFLEKAFETGEHVIVGLTTDEMVKEKTLASLILPFKKRLDELKQLLQEKSFVNRASLVSISDIYGPTVSTGKWKKLPINDAPPLRCQGDNTLEVLEIEALVVTQHTLENAEKINRKRQKEGLPPLKLIEVDLVTDDEGQPIASGKIRAGLVDRQGRVFHSPTLELTPRVISDKHRPNLRIPLGEFIEGKGSDLTLAAKQVIERISDNVPLVVSVGDVATKSLLLLDFRPSVAVVDLHVRREQVYQHVQEFNFPKEARIIKTTNPRGCVSDTLLTAVKDAITSYWRTKQMQVVKIAGEEDLAVLPVVLLSPPGSLVIYGQPPFGKDRVNLDHDKGKEGLVMIEVTEGKKLEVLGIIRGLPRQVITRPC